MITVTYEKNMAPKKSNGLIEVKTVRFDNIREAKAWIEGVRTIDYDACLKNFKIRSEDKNGF